MSENLPEVVTLEDLRRWQANPPPWEPEQKPVLAVIGDPVAHSLSPEMMNPALKEIGVNGRYIRLHLRDHQFAEAVRLMPTLGFIGTNVTIPHKFTALENVDDADPLARQLGSVNTILFEDNQLIGFNSDGPGFIRSLREAFQVDVSDLRVLIVGAGGGAGRSVAIQCALERCERLVLVNRTADKANALAQELRSQFSSERVSGPMARLEAIAWEEKALAHQLDNIDLIINGTSLGMKRTDPEVIPEHLIQPHHFVYDMVYRPRRTRLIASAEAAGARAINGLPMLLHQGAISFEIWFNRPAPIETMRRHLESAAYA